MIVESISAYTLRNLLFFYIYGKYKHCRCSLRFSNSAFANVNTALA